jgi:hypothetical protein
MDESAQKQMRPDPFFVAVALAAALIVAQPAAAAAPFDLNVAPPRAPATTVSTTIRLRDVLPDRFKKLVEDGGVLHLRVQAELWQRRPTWDRLVYPAIVRVLRFARGQSGRDVVVTGAGANASTYSALPNPMPLELEIGGADRLTATERYYVHAIATLGTLAEKETDEVSDALFGRPSESGTLGSLGRMVFRGVLQISDYLQSVTAESRSSTVGGEEILKGK